MSYVGCALGVLPTDQSIWLSGRRLFNDPWDWLAKVQAGNLMGMTPDQMWQLFSDARPGLVAIPEYAQVVEQLMWAIQGLRSPGLTAQRQALIVPAIREDWLAAPGTTIDFTDLQHWRVVVAINNNDVWTWDRVYNQMMRDGFGDIAQATADVTGELVSRYAGHAIPPTPIPGSGVTPPQVPGVSPGSPDVAPSPGPMGSVDAWTAWLAQYGQVGGQYAVAGVIIEVLTRGEARVIGQAPVGSGGTPPVTPSLSPSSAAPPHGNGVPGATGDGTVIEEEPPTGGSGIMIAGLALLGFVVLSKKKGSRRVRR
jgi:hypothetical protein